MGKIFWRRSSGAAFAILAGITLSASQIGAGPKKSTASPDSAPSAQALLPLIAPHVIDVHPSVNLEASQPGASLLGDFDMPMAAPTASTMVASGGQSGRLGGNYGGDQTNTVGLIPSLPRFPGEIVETTLTAGMQSTSGAFLATPYVWRCRTAAGQGPGQFPGQKAIGNGASIIRTADFNGDRALDLLVKTTLGSWAILAGDSKGNFITAATLSPGSGTRNDAVIADFDHDGYLDIAFANSTVSAVQFGAANFNFSASTTFGSGAITTIAAGDLNGDGFQDIVAGGPNVVCSVWLCSGRTFSAGGQFGVTTDNTLSLMLGDMDRDGDVDVVQINSGNPSAVFLNAGNASFGTATTTFRPAGDIVAAALGDIQGNGTLDVVIATDGGTNSSLYAYDNTGTVQLTVVLTEMLVSENG